MKKNRIVITVVLAFFLCVGLQSTEDDLYFSHNSPKFHFSPKQIITYEAEEGRWSDAVIDTKYKGFSGSGYVNTVNASGMWLEFTINVPEEVRAKLSWHYVNTTYMDRPATLSLDGEELKSRISFPGTWSWNKWGNVKTSINLGAGDHTVRLTATSGLGLASIDKMILSYKKSESADTISEADKSGFPGLTYAAIPGNEPEPGSLYFHYDDNSSSFASEYAKYQVANPYGNSIPDRINPLDFILQEDFDIGRSDRVGPFKVSMGLREALSTNSDYYKEYKLGISVEAPYISRHERKPAVITLLVDVSSEMRRLAPRVGPDTSSYLKLIQYGLMELADSLKPGDVVNLLTFKDEALLVSQGLTFKNDRDAYLAEIANLESAGTVDLETALDAGYKIARQSYNPHKINNLILITSQSEENPDIDKRMISKNAKFRRIRLSCLGVDLEGNNDFLKSLSHAGDGSFFTAKTKTDMIKTFSTRFYGLLEPGFTDVRFRLDFPESLLPDTPSSEYKVDIDEECAADNFSFNSKAYFFQGFKSKHSLSRFQNSFTLTISYTDARSGKEKKVTYKKRAYSILGHDERALSDAESILMFTDVYAKRKLWTDVKPLYELIPSILRFNFYKHKTSLYDEYTYLIERLQGEKFSVSPKILNFEESLLDQEKRLGVKLESSFSLSDVMITDTKIVQPEVTGIGYNSNGAMGIGSVESYSILGPTGVEIDDVKQLVSSRLKTFFIKNDGTLWATGKNEKGSLGIGSIDDFISEPVKVRINNVAAVASAENHTLILKTDGSLWVCGDNSFGQMGSAIEPGKLSIIPVKMVDSGVVSISAGFENSFYIMEDGSLWATGANRSGQLGTGDLNHRYEPVMVVDSGVLAVSAGENHTLILKDDNSVWGCGDNYYCSLGPISEDEHPDFVELFSGGIKKIAAGSSYSLIIKEDGTLWRVGRNTGRNVVTYYYYYGYTYSYYPTWQEIASEVVDVKAGSTHCMFMKEDGSLWGLGRNRSSELLNGRKGYLLDPVQIYASGIRDYTPGYHFSLVLRESPITFTNYSSDKYILKAPGDEENLDIGFTPVKEEPYNSLLIIKTNLPNKKKIVIPVTGLGCETLPTPTPQPTETPVPTPTLTPRPTASPKPTLEPIPWTGDIRFELKTTTVPLNIKSFQTTLYLDLPDHRVGAYGFDLYYDPSIVYTSESEDEEWCIPGADITSFVANGTDPGVIRMAGFEIDSIGPGTDLEICVITWYPVGAGTTELDIKVKNMIDSTYRPFDVTEVKSAGTIIVTEPY